LKVWRQQDAAKATVRTFVLTFPGLMRSNNSGVSAR
jgi:hypothetical protein